jgi:glycosyltransferase involved in cell wall biosynthesis
VINEYNKSDILAFVSTSEGFGMPILEANAVGRVVVTSNITSMPEVANNAAHYVNPF